RAGLASDPDGYFCAVEEGQIRGMVSALVRGRVWYLSMFFARPRPRPWSPGSTKNMDRYHTRPQIRGMVSALVRGRVWYLSMFFVLPGDQGRGLGRALLERALAYGEARGTEIRCTWATLDPRAQARYVMAGMAPRWPI